MSKKSKTQEPAPEIPLSKLREVLGDRYLANRPGFDKLFRKAGLAGIHITRSDYDRLMTHVRSMRSVERELMVDTSIFEPQKLVANRWDAEKQIKTTYERIKKSPYDSLTPPTPRKIRTKTVTRKATDVDVLVIPDCHFGWRQTSIGVLENIHDEAAIAIMLEVAKRAQPNAIVLLGDLLDLAGWSRFPTPSELRCLTEPALKAAYDFLVSLREACPNAEMTLIGGNHEARIENVLSTAVNEATTLRRPGDKYHVFSIPHLLRLDELSINFVGPYGVDYWRKGVRFKHGEIIGKAGGDTVSKMLKEYSESCVQGHTHRLELAWKTPADANGPRFDYAMNCGTLARLDGVVPGSAYPNWKQGFGVIRTCGRPQIFGIEFGSCYFDGAVIEAG